jgi:hypothetical protein
MDYPIPDQERAVALDDWGADDLIAGTAARREEGEQKQQRQCRPVTSSGQSPYRPMHQWAGAIPPGGAGLELGRGNPI